MNDGVSVFLAGVLFRHHHFRTEVALSWSVVFVRAPPYSIKRSCGAWTCAKWAPPILHYPAIAVCWNDPCSQTSVLKLFKPKPGTSHRTRSTIYYIRYWGLSETHAFTNLTRGSRDSGQHTGTGERKKQGRCDKQHSVTVPVLPSSSPA